jgi:hypothetical protein
LSPGDKAVPQAGTLILALFSLEHSRVLTSSNLWQSHFQTTCGRLNSFSMKSNTKLHMNQINVNCLLHMALGVPAIEVASELPVPTLNNPQDSVVVSDSRLTVCDTWLKRNNLPQ